MFAAPFRNHWTEPVLSDIKPVAHTRKERSVFMFERNLGSQGLKVTALGLGCMGMSEFYGARDDAESTATIHLALDRGIRFLDTADMYGPHTNEVLVGKAVKSWGGGHRDDVVIATKFGIVRTGTGPLDRRVDGTPKYVKEACEASLQRLGLETIDLYYQHRVDPNTPIEETVGAMAELVREGKVRYIGLSEAGPQTIRRANKVHPITAVQTEYSLWTRDPEDGVLQTCREVGIGFVAYSPLGRGFLTGQIKRWEDISDDDYRKHHPRFMGENFAKNMKLVEKIEELAARKGCTSSQLAIAWVLAQGDGIVPIPGTKRRKYLEQNLKALDVKLTAAELKEIDAIAPKGVAAGTRYPENMMSGVGR
jgi:aryl-alcohol dehydrogenase-like predicted oxidoreductase